MQINGGRNAGRGRAITHTGEDEGGRTNGIASGWRCSCNDRGLFVALMKSIFVNWVWC